MHVEGKYPTGTFRIAFISSSRTDRYLHAMTPLRGILVPLDGSALAEQALGPAAMLAKAAKTRIRLVLVHQVPSPPTTPELVKLYTSIEVATRRAARDYLLRQMEVLRRKGCTDVSRVVITGTPGPEIVKHAAEWDASLVVMSTHGRGALERAWLGSVADHVVRNVGVPVLLARPVAEGVRPLVPGGQILVPLDGSQFGEAALEPAVELARLLGAELRLMQIVRPVQMAMGGAMASGVSYDDVLLTAWQEQAREYLDRTAARLQSDGLRVVTEIVISPLVANTILEVEESEQSRVVAMATHGRGGLSRLFLGGVADKVVRGADCPVLVIPSLAKARRGISHRSSRFSTET